MLMKKSFVIKGTGRDLDSRIVESIRHLESEIILETEQADTSGLYHHTVTIKIGDITIDNEEQQDMGTILESFFRELYQKCGHIIRVMTG